MTTLFSFFGYNGIHLSIPSSLDFIKSIGNQIKGEITFVNEAGKYLEVQWFPLKKRSISELEKSIKGKQSQLKFQKTLKNETLNLFTLEGEEISNKLLICRQPDLDRAIIIYDSIHFSNEWLSEMCKPLMQKFENEHWAFFSVDFKLPFGFMLENSVLQVGSYALNFKRNSMNLSVYVISMINAPDNMTHLDWMKKFINIKFPKRFSFTEEKTLNGHSQILGHRKLRWLFNIKDLLTARVKVALDSISLNDGKKAFLLKQECKKSDHFLNVNEFGFKAQF